MTQKDIDPIFSYFKRQNQQIDPAFLEHTGVLRGYKISFPTWNFIYLFEAPATINIVEFSSNHTQGLQFTTYQFVGVLKELWKAVPTLQFIRGSIVEPMNEVGKKKHQKLLSIFEKLGVVLDFDENDYPCLLYAR